MENNNVGVDNCAVDNGGGLVKEFTFDLSEKDIEIYTVSYSGGRRGFGRETTTIIKYDCLKHDRFNYLKDYISYIVVSFTIEQLNKEIDFLISLKVPLVIFSEGYDEDVIKDKAFKGGVSLIISNTFAIPILDFWKKIQSLNDLPKGFTPRVHLTESHPFREKKFSDVGVTAMKYFAEKGFIVDLPDMREYKNSPYVSSGSLMAIRDESASLRYGVTPEYLDFHAYHSFFIHFDTKGIQRKIDYTFYFLEHFKKLESYHFYGILDVKVNLVKNGIEIVHNINGSNLYSQGVFNAINFLKTHKGQFTGLDLV
jgi:hypothetical protein